MRAALGDLNYLSRLKVLGRDAPKVIHWRGEPWQEGPSVVGIVGSRRASEKGRAWTFAVAQGLATRGITVVSGGALGIDAAAHEGALAGGGRTVAVLPTSVTRPTPRSHRRLFASIIEHGGTLLAEFDDPSLGRWAYAHRNRLIAALSDVILVPEAKARSGTRHTMNAALSLGRPVVCRRWPHGDERGAGGRALPEQIEWVEDENEVVSHVEGSPAPRPQASPDKLWSCLARPHTLDELSLSLSLQPDALTEQLFEAELEGRVIQVGGRWQRAP